MSTVEDALGGEPLSTVTIVASGYGMGHDGAAVEVNVTTPYPARIALNAAAAATDSALKAVDALATTYATSGAE